MRWTRGEALSDEEQKSEDHAVVEVSCEGGNDGKLARSIESRQVALSVVTASSSRLRAPYTQSTR